MTFDAARLGKKEVADHRNIVWHLDRTREYIVTYRVLRMRQMKLSGYKILKVREQMRRLARLTRLSRPSNIKVLLSVVSCLFKTLLQLDHGFHVL